MYDDGGISGQDSPLTSTPIMDYPQTPSIPIQFISEVSQTNPTMSTKTTTTTTTSPKHAEPSKTTAFNVQSTKETTVKEAHSPTPTTMEARETGLEAVMTVSQTIDSEKEKETQSSKLPKTNVNISRGTDIQPTFSGKSSFALVLKFIRNIGPT